MASNSRHLGRLLGTDTKIKTDDIAGGVQLGLSFYTDEASLPTEGNILGAKAYAELEGTLHLWNGYGWGPIAVTEWDYTPPPFGLFQGSSYGYITAGQTDPGANVIRQFSFVSDGNATNIGVLSTSRKNQPAGNSSDVAGYTAGGSSGNNYLSRLATIEKFPFANPVSSATVTATLAATGSLYKTIGHSSINNSVGYTSTGHVDPANTVTMMIQKFSFIADTNATYVGELISTSAMNSPQAATPQQSPEYGYVSSMPINPSSTFRNKFSFSSDGNSVNVATVAKAGGYGGGTSSEVSGYANFNNIVIKFPFASDANTVDVGFLNVSRFYVAGVSSTASGYHAGETGGNTTYEKYSFASDGNATVVGNLASANYLMCGQQV
jgi:hypothetical protein